MELFVGKIRLGNFDKCFSYIIKKNYLECNDTIKYEQVNCSAKYLDVGHDELIESFEDKSKEEIIDILYGAYYLIGDVTRYFLSSKKFIEKNKTSMKIENIFDTINNDNEFNVDVKLKLIDIL